MKNNCVLCVESCWLKKVNSLLKIYVCFWRLCLLTTLQFALVLVRAATCFAFCSQNGTGGMNVLECKLVPPFIQNSTCQSLRLYAKLMQSTFFVVLCCALHPGTFFPEPAALLLDAPRYRHSALRLVCRMARLTTAKRYWVWIQHKS